MNSVFENFISITDAAQKVGNLLFPNDWRGDEFHSDEAETQDEAARSRAKEVHKSIRTILQDGRIRAWTVDEEGTRWPLEHKIVTEVGFKIDLPKGLVGGMWGPDTLSNCVFDADEFSKLIGEQEIKHSGGRPTEYKWDKIVHEGWRKVVTDGFDTVEALADHLAQWCENKYQRQPDIADIRRRVRKIRDDFLKNN